MAINNPYSLKFNGSNTYIQIPHIPQIAPKRQLMIELRVKLTSIPSTWFSFIYKGKAGQRECAFWQNGTSATMENDFPPSGDYSVKPYAFTTNTWYFITWVINKDTGQFKIYVNGNLFYQLNTIGTSDTTFGTNPLYVAYNGEFGIFGGVVDELRIWNAERTQSQIQKYSNIVLKGNESNLVALYKLNEGTGNIAYDYSVNKNNGTIYNGTWVSGEVNLLSNKYLILDGNRVKETPDAINLLDIGQIPLDLSMFNTYGMDDLKNINNTVIDKISDNQYKVGMYVR